MNFIALSRPFHTTPLLLVILLAQLSLLSFDLLDELLFEFSGLREAHFLGFWLTNQTVDVAQLNAVFVLRE